ncbi:MAG: DUF2267 domain-containing protein [Gammaproteobacteria bacterium]|nr:DUF2267 domain-containing protein [Gammaproteobacteria bacterium]NNC68541.1 DUF2267 domain-containing protein [Gammaproteobacteria bacterium]
MSSTGIKIFDTTLQKTFVWLHAIMDETGVENSQQAYSALRAVLHAIRDRLMVDEAMHLGAQLPMLIRGFYYEGWTRSGKPLKYRHKEDFVAEVSKNLPGLSDDDMELTIQAVFKVLTHQITGGEIDQVKQQLPAGVRELWKEPVPGL